MDKLYRLTKQKTPLIEIQRQLNRSGDAILHQMKRYSRFEPERWDPYLISFYRHQLNPRVPLLPKPIKKREYSKPERLSKQTSIQGSLGYDFEGVRFDVSGSLSFSIVDDGVDVDSVLGDLRRHLDENLFLFEIPHLRKNFRFSRDGCSVTLEFDTINCYERNVLTRFLRCYRDYLENVA